MAQTYTQHQDPGESLDQPEQPDDGATAVEHAVVQAVLRSSLELHGALSMLGTGYAADRLREALGCMDKAVNEVRRAVAQRYVDASR